MNYEGNEELREDIARLANDVHELQQRMKLLEQKYLWNTENLTHRFAGQTLHTAGVACSALHQQIYDLDLIFSD
ncbi:hypothetical protein UK30_10115 [Salmonella enterica]|uniref:hypothetical protein n=1 Tax=Salmonella enterica TaxID=28901 RepID=UPI0009AD3347|nr:hypothetical protein [Salmonella enterica]EBP4342198.1 hypothetical protein [Salmonella enterica]